MAKPTVLLIISGGIAAYKALDLIRRLQDRGIDVRAVMTKAAQAFVTPLAVGSLTGGKVYTDLFDGQDEFDVAHIRLAREPDAIVIAPATADLMSKMAGGHADDLATTILLATDKPVFVAPAMNPHMWAHPATQRNIETLTRDGIRFIGPETGEMAEKGEAGTGRMTEPAEIADVVADALASGPKTLTGRHVLVTSGPTHEPIDPVRYIANRSSGKQGHAMATAARDAGARVTLISGPVAIAHPDGVHVIPVETAGEMLAAVEQALPTVDAVIMAAAVADWRVDTPADAKIKKTAGGDPPSLAFIQNPDILATVGGHPSRPPLVIGFAAETDDLLKNADAKRQAKGADWIVANDVSPETGVMGGDHNTVHLVSADGVETWPTMAKHEVAARLIARLAEELQDRDIQA